MYDFGITSPHPPVFYALDVWACTCACTMYGDVRTCTCIVYMYLYDQCCMLLMHTCIFMHTHTHTHAHAHAHAHAHTHTHTHTHTHLHSRTHTHTHAHTHTTVLERHVDQHGRTYFMNHNTRTVAYGRSDLEASTEVARDPQMRARREMLDRRWVRGAPLTTPPGSSSWLQSQTRIWWSGDKTWLKSSA